MVHYIDEFPDRLVHTKKGSFHYFGGTSYLGLQTHAAFQELLIKNIHKYGTHYGASRVSNVRFSIYAEAEQYLSNLIGTQACITLSSGYMASQLVSRYFSGEKYKQYHSPHSHESLLNPGHTNYSSYRELKHVLQKNPKDITAVICLDTIDFMGINYPDFEGLKSLDLQNCILLVDDSHGFGILGNNGQGSFTLLNDLGSKELILCGSLGKGFGLAVGGIFGERSRIEQLSQTSFFGGGSPASPAVMATLIESQHLVKSQRKKLHTNLKHFRALLQKTAYFIHCGDHPSFSFTDEQLTHYLYQHKILLTSFNYPTKDSPLMSRIVISAYHTKEDIEFLATTINAYEKTS